MTNYTCPSECAEQWTGWQDGYSKGYQKGYREGWAEAVTENPPQRCHPSMEYHVIPHKGCILR